MELPDDNPKTKFGIQKTPIDLVPPSAIRQCALAFKLGAEKYGPYNWRTKTVSSSTYMAAAMRHIMAWWDGENEDPESGASHLGHAMACMAILLDAEAQGRLNDNRPPAQPYPALYNSQRSDTVKETR